MRLVPQARVTAVEQLVAPAAREKHQQLLGLLSYMRVVVLEDFSKTERADLVAPVAVVTAVPTVFRRLLERTDLAAVAAAVAFSRVFSDKVLEAATE